MNFCASGSRGAPQALLRQLREDLIGQQVERLGDDRLIRRGVMCRDKPFDGTSRERAVRTSESETTRT